MTIQKQSHEAKVKKLLWVLLMYVELTHIEIYFFDSMKSFKFKRK